MTRNLSIYAHDVEAATWDAFVADIEAALAKVRAAPGGTTAGGSVYNSHADPANRTL